jgi:hypothetical protein
MKTINFGNKEFLVREIELSEIETVLISTNSLNELLINENGSYFSDEAISIDENIFYYVNDNEIRFSDEELINLIEKELR